VRITFEANGKHGPRAVLARDALEAAIGTEHVV